MELTSETYNLASKLTNDLTDEMNAKMIAVCNGERVTMQDLKDIIAKHVADFVNKCPSKSDD